MKYLFAALLICALNSYSEVSFVPEEVNCKNISIELYKKDPSLDSIGIMGECFSDIKNFDPSKYISIPPCGEKTSKIDPYEGETCRSEYLNELYEASSSFSDDTSGIYLPNIEHCKTYEINYSSDGKISKSEVSKNPTDRKKQVDLCYRGKIVDNDLGNVKMLENLCNGVAFDEFKYMAKDKNDKKKMILGSCNYESESSLPPSERGLRLENKMSCYCQLANKRHSWVCYDISEE